MKVLRSLVCGMVLLVLCGAPATAQTAFYVGVTGGPQLTTFSGNHGDYSNILGYYGGVTTEMRFGSTFGLSLDAYYNRVGAHRGGYDSLVLYDRTIRTIYNRDEYITYATFPLLANIYIPISPERIIPYDKPGRKTAIRLFVGPYSSIFLGYDREGTTETVGVAHIKRPDGSDSILYRFTDAAPANDTHQYFVNYLDIGIMAGVGIDFSVGDKASLGFDFRFSRGFLTIDEIKYLNWDNNPRYFPGLFGRQFWNQKDDVITYQRVNLFNQAIGFNIRLKYRLFGYDPYIER